MFRINPKGSRRKTTTVVVSAENRKPTRKSGGNKKNVRARNKKKRIVNHNSRSALTPAGTAFLKCTMSPADFAIVENFSGIPDEYDGSSVTRNLTCIGPLPTGPTGEDLYIIQMPIPGVAYLYGTRTAGSTGNITFVPVYYDSITTLFPIGNEASNVESFRFASNVIEIIPTANEMTMAGSIQIWKSQVNMGHQMAPTTGSTSFISEFPFLEGVSAINSTKPSSVFPMSDGVYVPSFNSQSSFPWTPVTTGTTYTELNVNQALGNIADRFFTLNDNGTPFIGLGTYETTIIKIPTLAAGQSGIIRAWCCLELQVPTTSIIYDYRHVSPLYDPLALALLKKYHSSLTTAVTWKQNANFWQNFIKWSRTILRGTSFIPGPLGVISKASLDIMDNGIGI